MDDDRDRTPTGPDGDDGGGPLDLRLALAEHRPHVLGATALFAAGVLGGLVVAAAGVDALAALRDLLPEDVDLDWWFVFQNNVTVLLGPLLVLGVLTLGLLTVVTLAGNGLVVGAVAGQVAAERGVALVLVLLLPHGVVELPAFWIGGGVAFRFLHLAVNRLRGKREQFVRRDEAARSLLLVAIAVGMLAVAAAIEVYVTPALAEALFGSFQEDAV